MSIETVEQLEAVSDPPVEQVRTYRQPEDEFQYRPVSSLAVCTLVLGVLSLVGIFLWMMLPVGLLAIALGVISLISIRRWEGEYTGKGVAITGMFFGLVTLGAGTAVQVYAFQHEVPPGYERVSFVKDISAKEPVIDRRGRVPHPDVMALDGKKVFFKGFVYPTEKNTGLTSFLLLKDSEECCFGGQPKLEDKVGCILQKGKSCNYMAGRVSVAGTFRINPKYAGGSDAIYLLETDIVMHSKSDF